MFVKVKIYSDGATKGRAYTYESDLNLVEGDIVLADMAGGDKLLQVVGIATEEEVAACTFEIKKIKSKVEDLDTGEVQQTVAFSVIEESLPVIKINFEQMKDGLSLLLSDYKGIEVTESNLQGCKSTQKELAGLRRKIDTYRKDKKAELSAPVVAFENQCKELISLIDSVESPIKDGIKVFDDKKKDGQREKAASIRKEVIEETGLTEKYAARLDIIDRYCNLTATASDVKNDMVSRAYALKVEQDREDEITDILKETISSESKRLKTELQFDDFKRLIDKGLSAKDIISEIRERAERIYQAENAPKEEVAEKIVVPEAKEPENDKNEESTNTENPVSCFMVCKVTGNLDELKSVLSFMSEKGISYFVKDQGEL